MLLFIFLFMCFSNIIFGSSDIENPPSLFCPSPASPSAFETCDPIPPSLQPLPEKPTPTAAEEAPKKALITTALPVEVLALIFSFLDSQGLRNAKLSCRTFNAVITENNKRLFYSTFRYLSLSALPEHPSPQYITTLTGFPSNYTGSKNKELLERFPHLQTLDFSHTKELKGRSFKDLGDRIHTLYFEKAWGFDWNDWMYLSKLTNLRKLSLKGSHCINSSTYAEIRRLPNLTSLNLSGCFVTDGNLISFCRSPKIFSLNLASCIDITDRGIFYLSSLPSLHTLILDYLPHLTDKALKSFESFPFLQKVSVIGCSKITAKGIKSLRAKLPALTILHDFDNIPTYSAKN